MQRFVIKPSAILKLRERTFPLSYVVKQRQTRPDILQILLFQSNLRCVTVISLLSFMRPLLMPSRMKGSLIRSRVLCLESEINDLEIKLVPYDPGSTFAVLWSFILPSKRRININTLCDACLEDIDCISAKEELDVILKKREQTMSKRKATWVRQQWEFWVTSSEYQAIYDTLQEKNGLSVHLFGNAALS